jgi:hypothetical protein
VSWKNPLDYPLFAVSWPHGSREEVPIDLEKGPGPLAVNLRTFWPKQVHITRVVKEDDNLHDFQPLLLQMGRLAGYQALCPLIRSEVKFPSFHPSAIKMREVGLWLY